MNCTVKINLTPFLSAAQELTAEHSGELLTIKADTFPELVEAVAKKIASIKSPVDAYFEIAYQEESQTIPITAQQFKYKVKGKAKERYEEYKEELVKQLTAQGEGNMSVVITSFLNSSSNLFGDDTKITNRVEYLLKRYDSFSKKKPNNKYVYDEALRALYYTLSKQYQGTQDSTVKATLLQQLRSIKDRLGEDEQVAMVFPAYVQTLYNTMDKENNTYFIESEIKDFFQSELTASIVSNLQRKIEQGEPLSIGIAKRDNDGTFKLYNRTFKDGVWTDTLVHDDTTFTEENLYIPKTRHHGKRDRFHQEVYQGDENRVITPRHGDASIEDELLEDLEIHLSRNISVIGNLMTISGIQEEVEGINENLSGITYGKYPVFTANREKVLSTDQIFYEFDNGWKQVAKPVDSYITKGLNLKGDAILSVNGRYIGELDTMNYYRVRKDGVEEVPLDEMTEEFFTNNFTASKYILSSKATSQWMEMMGTDFVPFYVLKEIDYNRYEDLLNNYLKKVEIAKVIQKSVEGLDNSTTMVSGKDLPNIKELFGIDKFFVTTGVNPAEPTPLTDIEDEFKSTIGGETARFFVLRTTKEAFFYKETDTELELIDKDHPLFPAIQEKSKDYTRTRTGISIIVSDNNSYTELEAKPNRLDIKTWIPSVTDAGAPAVGLQFTLDKDSAYIPLSFYNDGDNVKMGGFVTPNNFDGFTQADLLEFPQLLRITLPIGIGNFLVGDFERALLDASATEFSTYITSIDRTKLNEKLSKCSPELNGLVASILNVTTPQRIKAVKDYLKPRISVTNFSFSENVSREDIASKAFLSKTSLAVDIENPVSKFINYKFTPDAQNVVTPEIVQDETIQIDADDFDLAFQLEDQMFFENDIPVDPAYARRVLGDVTFRSVEENFHLFSAADRKVLGAALKNIIFLSEDAKQSTLYHETFHIAFNNLFTPDEQRLAIKLAKERFAYTDQEVNDYANLIGLSGTFESKEIRFVHEKLADGFAQWRLDRGNSVWRDMLGSIIDFFENLLDMIGLYQKDELKSIYKLVDSGKLKYRKQGTTSEEVFYSVKNEKNGVLASSEFDRLAQEIFAISLDYKTKFTGTRKAKIEVLDSILNSVATLQYLQSTLEKKDSKVEKMTQYFGGAVYDKEGNARANYNSHPNIEENRWLLFEKLNDLYKIHNSLHKSRIVEQQFTDDRLSEEPEIPEVSDDEDLDVEITGKQMDEAAYQVDPTQLEPELLALFNRLSVKVPRPNRGLAGLTQKASGNIFHTVDPKKIIAQLQRDFSGTILDTETYEQKLEAFFSLLNEYSQVNSDYKALSILLNAYKDNTKETLVEQYANYRHLINKLVNKVFLDQVEFNRVVSKAEEKLEPFMGLQSLSTFEDTKRFKDLRKKLEESFNGQNFGVVRLKNKLFINNTFYSRIEGVWYKHKNELIPHIFSQEPLSTKGIEIVSQEEVEALYTKTFSGVNPVTGTNREPKEVRAQVVEHLTRLENFISNQGTDTLSKLTAKAQLIEAFFNHVDINISPAYSVTLAKDASTKKFLTNIIGLADGKPISEVDRRNFAKLLRYGGSQYITSTKLYGGKTVWAFTQSSITKAFKRGKRFLRGSKSYIPSTQVYVADGMNVEFSAMTKGQQIKFYVGNWLNGLVNLGQLEGNSTNFSVTAKKKDGITSLTREDMEAEILAARENPEYFKQQVLDIQDEVLSSIYTNIKTIDEKLFKARETGSLLSEGWEGVDKPIFFQTEEGIVLSNDTFFTMKGGKAIMNRGFSTFFGFLNKMTLNGNTYDFNNLTQEQALEFIDAVRNTSDFQFKTGDSIWELVLNDAKSKAKTMSKTEGARYFVKNEKGETRPDPKAEKLLEIFNLSYFVKKHEALKTAYGNSYWQTFKNDTSDWTKRAKSLGIFGEEIREHKLILVEDDLLYLVRDEDEFGENDYKVSSDKNSGGDKIEATDGQSVASLIHRIDTLEDKTRLSNEAIAYYAHLLSNGNYTYKFKDGIWSLVESDPKYISSLRDKGSNFGFVNGVYKTAGGGKAEGNFIYIKQSEFAPPINLYAKDKPETKVLYKELLNSLFTAGESLHRIDRDEATQKDIYRRIYETLTPIKGQEKVFKWMQTLDMNQIDHLVFQSGSKTLSKVSTIDYAPNGNSQLQVITVPKGVKKHQTEVTNWHDHMTASSQQEWYLIQDQNNEVSVMYNGERITTKELLNKYSEALGQRIQSQFDTIFGVLEKGDTAMLQFLLEEFVGAKRSREYVKDFFDINGKFNRDLPITSDLYVNFVQNLLKNVLSSSVKGEGFLLLASSLYQVSEVDGFIIPSTERTNEPTRPLETYLEVFENGKWTKRTLTQEDKDNKDLIIRQVDEMVVPPSEDWHYEYIAIKKQLLKSVKDGESTLADVKETLDLMFPQELFYTMTTRIPCENKRSMSVCKVIDFLDSSLGSVCIVPAHQMKRTGHDFDGDKLWSHLPHVVKVNDWYELASESNTPFDAADEIHNSKILKSYMEFTLKHDETYLELEDKYAATKEAQKNEIVNYGGKPVSLSEASSVARAKRDWDTVDQIKAINKENKAKLDLIKEELKARKAFLLEEYIAKYNNKITQRISASVIENNILQTQMGLASNREVLLSRYGFQREETDLGDFENATAKFLGLINREKTLSVTAAIDIENNNIANQNAASIGIAAAMVKLRVLLDAFGLDAPHEGKPFNTYSTPKNTKPYEIYAQEIATKAEEWYGIKFNPTFKSQSQNSALMVSAATDAPKGGFIDGINLTDLTTSFYAFATMLGYPTGHAILVANHPAVRHFTSSAKNAGDLKKNIKDYIRDRMGKSNFPIWSVDTLYVKPTLIDGSERLVFEKDKPSMKDLQVLQHFVDITASYDDVAELGSITALNKGGLSLNKLLSLLEMLDRNNTGMDTMVGLFKKPHHINYSAVLNNLDKFPYIKTHLEVTEHIAKEWLNDSMLSNSFASKVVNESFSSVKEKQIRFLTSALYAQQMRNIGIQNPKFQNIPIQDEFFNYKGLRERTGLVNIFTKLTKALNQSRFENTSFARAINIDDLSFTFKESESNEVKTMEDILVFQTSDLVFANGSWKEKGDSTEYEYTAKDYVDLLVFIDSVKNGFMNKVSYPKEVIEQTIEDYNLTTEAKPNQIEDLLISNPYEFGAFSVDESVQRESKEYKSEMSIVSVPVHLFNRLNPNVPDPNSPSFIQPKYIRANDTTVSPAVSRTYIYYTTTGENSTTEHQYYTLDKTWWQASNRLALNQATGYQLLGNLLFVDKSTKKLDGIVKMPLEIDECSIVNYIGVTTVNGVPKDVYHVTGKTLSTQFFTEKGLEERPAFADRIVEAIYNEFVEDSKNPNLAQYKHGVAEIYTSESEKKGLPLEEKNMAPNTQILTMDQFTNHSGGAKGGDTIWDSEGRKVGVTNHNHYTVEYYDTLTSIEKAELDIQYLETVKFLGRGVIAANTYVGKLVRRDMIQANQGDAIFGITELVKPKIKGRKGYQNKMSYSIPEGGTGYAVTRGILLGKPVYVFNQSDSYGNEIGWYKWDASVNDFVKTNTPLLTKNFTGIGSTAINNLGEQAIKEVYAKTSEYNTPSDTEYTPYEEVKPMRRQYTTSQEPYGLSFDSSKSNPELYADFVGEIGSLGSEVVYLTKEDFKGIPENKIEDFVKMAGVPDNIILPKEYDPRSETYYELPTFNNEGGDNKSNC